MPISADATILRDGSHTTLHNFVADAKAHFAAVGDGVADDTTKLQATIDSQIGAGAVLGSFRQGGYVQLPPGDFKIIAPLTVHNVQGLKIIGSGMRQTRIVVGANMAQAIELDGVSLSEMSNFQIIGDGTHTATRGVFLHWDNTTSGGGTRGNMFRQVYVDGATLKCDIGWAVGTDNTLEVDTCTWIDCHTSGGQASAATGGTWSDPKWQYGWKFGSDTVGNCLDHTMIGCVSDHWVNGVGATGTSLNVIGGEVQHNKVDFYHTAPNAGYLNTMGVRSEWSERLYDSGINGNPAQVTITGGTWNVNHLPADNRFIRFQSGGQMNISALKVQDFFSNPGATPKILTGSTKTSMLSIRGVTVVNTAPGSFIDNNDASVGQWRIEDFTQLDGATGLAVLHIAEGFGSDYKSLAYSASIATDVGKGRRFSIVATNGTAFTISNPTNPMSGMEVVYDIKNSSGGALGVITWGAAFLLAGAFTNPANTKRRTISFYYDGTNWVETNRAAADI